MTPILLALIPALATVAWLAWVIADMRTIR